jgi:two-component system LytT family response regulator
MNPIQAIVVDDVAESRKTLIRDIKDYCPEIIILGEADGVVSAARLIRQVKPELIFLDIQMQDGSGFDLLDIIGEENIKVIFTTASDAFALKAFRYAALDYLLKTIYGEEL